MTALSLIDSLAGRGLVLSIEGTRIQASPRRLLSDQDRHLIRQFRDELFSLLSEGMAAKTSEEAEREAIREEPLVGSSPDIRFHDELARWPISWREVWGRVTNAIEDTRKADGLSTSGAGLTAFTGVTRLAGNGMTPDEALAAIWRTLGLPGEPPALDWKPGRSLPRHEPLDEEEALRQILSIPAGAPWPALRELIESARQCNAATAPRCGQSGKAIKNHQPMEMTTDPTIMGRVGDEVGSDHPAPLIRPLS
jgi:hypothetical protein